MGNGASQNNRVIASKSVSGSVLVSNMMIPEDSKRNMLNISKMKLSKLYNKENQQYYLMEREEYKLGSDMLSAFERMNSFSKDDE